MDKRHKQPDTNGISNDETNDSRSASEPGNYGVSGSDTTTIRTDNPTTTEPIQPVENASESGNAEPVKRRPGRPRKEPATNEQGNVTFSVQEKQKRVKRSSKPDERKLYTPDEALATSKLLLGMVQAIGVSIGGDEAIFNQMEDILLNTSLPPLLERMNVTSAEKTANILYPLCIAFAGVSYGIRVYRLKQEQNPVMANDIDIPEYDNGTEPTKPVSYNPFANSRGLN